MGDRADSNYGLASSCRIPDYLHAILQQHTLTLGMHTIVEAGDGLRLETCRCKTGGDSYR